jgi:sugar lactone lactonase YvrE
MAASDDVPTYETLTIDNVCRDVITISEVSTVLLTDGTKQAFIESWSAVGESIFYRKADQTLHFVDIRRHLLHRVTLTPDDNELSLWSNHVVIHTKDAIGVAAEVEGNTDLLVIGAKYGFAVVEIETGEMKYVARVYTSKADAERYVRGRTDEQAFSDYNIGFV